MARETGCLRPRLLETPHTVTALWTAVQYTDLLIQQKYKNCLIHRFKLKMHYELHGQDNLTANYDFVIIVQKV